MITRGETYLNTALSNAFAHNAELYAWETNDAGKSLASEKMRGIYNDLLYVFDNKKVYLDAQLNLAKLSQILFTNTTYLSRVINVFFKCNLKTLLNKYRIDYAKELLKEEECDIRTLPAKCGFLSRSTFYSAFAKFEHITPSAFRSRMLSLKLRGEEI